ncbi:hypothetical protein SpCBS45565_g02855 [Spizellomyces sp. 'palustris']|nr:hypothetical protein SpCBS45565_g02855 [Spizellomyces sp. 'palustris']
MGEDQRKRKREDPQEETRSISSLKDSAPSKPPPRRSSKITVAGFPWQYLKIRLTTEPPCALEQVHYRNAINHALQEAFGAVGAAHHVDLLDFEQDCQEGLIRTPYEYVNVD